MDWREIGRKQKNWEADEIIPGYGSWWSKTK